MLTRSLLGASHLIVFQSLKITATRWTQDSALPLGARGCEWGRVGIGILPPGGSWATALLLGLKGRSCRS
eukprot:5555751-Pleurochrysis_carterae.AAC.1